MKRREFVGAMVGAVIAARADRAAAQPRAKVPLVAILESGAPAALARYEAAFVKRFAELGWTDGHTVRFEFRRVGPDQLPAAAAELVGLAPDLILAQSNPATAALLKRTRTIPIVMMQAGDPVGSGFVESLARPGGNVTGFTSFEFEMGGKWLDVLREVAPRVKDAAVLMHPETSANIGFWRAAEAAAPSLGLRVSAAGIHDASEIERVLSEFGPGPERGLVVLPHPVTLANIGVIVEHADRLRLPAIYPFRAQAAAGGLVAYGSDPAALFRRAADYADRILKGAAPGELPIQQPDKYELVINLTTAKALGLVIPLAMLTRADEVIE